MTRMNLFLAALFLFVVSVGSSLFAEESGVVPMTSEYPATGEPGEVLQPSAGYPVAEDASLPGADDSIQMAQKEIQDPFRVGVEPAELAPQAAESSAANDNIVLQGMGVSRQGVYAIISGDIYTQGEEKKGIKIVEARRSEVDILVNGAARTLSLVSSEEVQRAQDRRERKTRAASPLPAQ